MNTPLNRTRWDELFPLDTVAPMTAVFQGIEYQGDVVRTGRWSAKFKVAPEGGSHFKIVLLQDRPRSNLPQIKDQNTAICVPGPGSGRRVLWIIGEITAAQQATYLTRRDADAAAINSAFRDRRHDLESRLISEESARFAKGVIWVQGGPGPDPEAIFAGSDPAKWIEGLAHWLLARSYPNLPLDAHRPPHPICRDDAGRLFASLFRHAGPDSNLLRSIGPALGLSSPDLAGSYDPPDCTVFTLIQEKIGGRTAPFAEVHRYLAYDVGLTSELASLFLCCSSATNSPSIRFN